MTAYNANGPASGTLSYVGDLLTFTSDGTGTTPGTMSDLVISLAAINDSLVEGPESYTVALTTPGSTTSAPVTLDAATSAITTITDANTATWSLTGDTGVTEGKQCELHRAPGRHAAGGRDGDDPSGSHRRHHHQR